MAAWRTSSTGFVMTKAAHIRNEVLCITLFALLFPSGAMSGELHVYLSNANNVSGKEVSLDERSLSILTPHCGRMVIERSAIKGISSDTKNAREILDFVGESDVVHNRNGDRLSGPVVEIKDDAIFIEAFFAGEKIAKVEAKQLDYLVFASQKKAKPTSKPDRVRVIFTNGDVISGKLVGFESGQFILDPPYCEELRFGAAAFRSLHNAKQSREFFAGGIAEALMDVLGKSGGTGAVYEQIYSLLVSSFLKDDDKQGALLIFRRSAPHVKNQHVFQVIGDQFLAHNMHAAAVEAYEKMLEKAPTSYYPYIKLFKAYMKTGRYAEAAETYEHMVSDPMVNLPAYDISVGKIRMDLGDVYIKLKKFDKAAEHFRRVIVSSTEQEDVRTTALRKLVGLFRQQGKIETLLERYNAELARNNKLLGESYLEVVRIHFNEGKMMKARSYVERLDKLGLTEYAEEARQLWTSDERPPSAQR